MAVTSLEDHAFPPHADGAGRTMRSWRAEHRLGPLLTEDWRCPGCNLPGAGLAGRSIVLHHDHIEDYLVELGRPLDAVRLQARQPLIRHSAGFRSLVLTHRLFPPSPLCMACNHRDGSYLKWSCGALPGFSFSPKQILELHHGACKDARLRSAKAAWLALKGEHEELVARARRDWADSLRSAAFEPTQQHFPSQGVPPSGLSKMLETSTYPRAKWIVREALKLLAARDGPFTVASALARSWAERRRHDVGLETVRFRGVSVRGAPTLDPDGTSAGAQRP